MGWVLQSPSALLLDRPQVLHNLLDYALVQGYGHLLWMLCGHSSEKTRLALWRLRRYWQHTNNDPRIRGMKVPLQSCAQEEMQVGR